MKELIEFEYGMIISRINTIESLDSEVFLISNEGGKKFKFKVYKNLRPGEEGKFIQIDEWAKFVIRQVQVPVPRIISLKNGDKHLKLPYGRIGYLYEWIDWKVIDQFDQYFNYRIGCFLKKIHNCTKTYNGKKHFIKKIDADWIKIVARNCLITAAKDFNLGNLDSLKRKLNYFSKWIKNEESDKNFGLIHSDLHRKNIIYKGDEISIIDLDDTVHCSYLLDIAVIFNEFEDHPESVELFKLSFLEGYGIESTSSFESEIKMYQIIADIIYSEWVFRLLQEGESIEQSKIKYGIEALKRIIAI